MIVENKTHGLGAETTFDFKYIPDFHTRTVKGEMEETGLREPGIERRSLKTLVIASVAICIVSWYGTKAAVKMAFALVR